MSPCNKFRTVVVEASKEVIGLDVGLKMTGFARASSIARLAEPLESVETTKAIDRLKELLARKDVEAVVIGLPRNLKGDDTAQTSWVREWTQAAKDQIDKPLYYQDEALTSKLAEIQKSKVKNQVDEHALAASIILQDFLDTPEAERVVS